MMVKENAQALTHPWRGSKMLPSLARDGLADSSGGRA